MAVGDLVNGTVTAVDQSANKVLRIKRRTLRGGCLEKARKSFMGKFSYLRGTKFKMKQGLLKGGNNIEN